MRFIDCNSSSHGGQGSTGNTKPNSTSTDKLKGTEGVNKVKQKPVPK